MTKRIATVTSAILLVLGLAAFSGSALAGTGQGNGNAKTGAAGTAAGNSANGPGNSQPHKVSNCVHPAKNNNGGGVDVHAVKSYPSAHCTSSTGTTVRTTTSNNTTLGTTATTKGKASTAHGNVAQGGVLGASA